MAFLFRLCCCAIVFATSSVSRAEPPNAEAYVEFDFSTLPRGGTGTYTVKMTVETKDKDITFSEPLEFARVTDPNTNCEFVAVFLNRNKWKAEVVNKTKLRVYGRIWNDKLIPATRGKVESSDLRPEELPKVKNPEKKG